MRAIASDFFATSPLMAGPQVAMIIFLAIFVLVALRIARGGAKQWEQASRLPLEDGAFQRESSMREEAGRHE